MRRASIMVAAASVTTIISHSAQAFEFDTGTDLKARWDNTVKYSAAWRIKEPSSSLLANVNGDDGNRNFKKGLISNRIDLLSELDVSYKSVGLRISGAAWYDAVYNQSNDNASPATANSFSVPHNRFTDATRKLHGRKAEILDAFIFANGRVGNMPASVRAGKHTLLWGESLLIPTNGMSYAQAPIDGIKALSVPNTPSKELFMPVGQVSAQVSPTIDLSLGAYYQYDWRKARIPAAGSYFGATDILDDGGERLLAGAGRAFFRGRDMQARDSGQWGVSTRYRSQALDTEFGLYAMRFHERNPQVYLRPGAAANPAIGKIGEYTLVYPENIRVIGASFSTNAGTASVAGEVHVRRNTPLASNPQTILPGSAADNSNNPRYAIGNTVHAQVSIIQIISGTALWPTATLTGEIGAQRLTSITRNRNAFLSTRDRSAWGLRLIFTPTYFQVWPNLDLSVPIGVGYNPRGKAPIPGFNGGAHRGGDFSIGVNAEFEKAWNAGLRYTHYFGPQEFQPFKDRRFVALSVQRTF